MRRWSAARVYLGLTATVALANACMFTTYAVYYIRTLHLGPLRLVLVGTALEVSYHLFELPTGALADARGRRPCLVAGTAILGAAFLFEGAIPALYAPTLPHAAGLFALLIGAEVVRGSGEALLSGADQAWIAGEVGDAAAGGLYLRAARFGQAAALIGTGAGVALATAGLNLPYLAGGALYLALGLFLLLTLRESGFRPAGGSARDLRRTLPAAARAGFAAIRARPVLWGVLGGALFTGASSEGADRLWEAHLLHTFGLPGLWGLPTLAWFGVVGGAGSILGFAATLLAERLLTSGDPRAVARALVVCTAARMLALLSFGLAPGFGWAVGSVLGMAAAAAVQGPVLAAWLNAHIAPDVRATVLSILGQTDALGQAAGGPAVGWIGARVSLRAAMVTAAVLLGPAVGVYWRAGRREAGPGTAARPA